MRTILFFLVAANWLLAQDSMPRLVAAGKLWARIQYTHPGLASKEIDWDNAFAKAAPKILGASTSAEYQSVLDEMLQALRDPATHVRGPGEAVAPRPPAFRREQGAVVFDPGHGNAEKLKEITSSLFQAVDEAKVRGLIIDARRSPALDDEWSDSLNPQSSPATTLVSLRWSGYPNPQVSQGYAHDHYHRSFNTTVNYPVRGRSTTKPIIVIASRLTKLPLALISAQLAGTVSLVLEGTNAYCAMVPCQSMPLVEGLTAMIRTHEFIHGDGRYGFSPQREVASGGIEAALELLNRPTRVVELPRGLALKPFVEKGYRETTYPDEGLRLLGALKAWSVIEYFFPYKHLIGEDWDGNLVQVLGETKRATNGLEYHLAIARLIARTNDSHGQVFSKELDRRWGPMPPPFTVRWVEGSAAVVALLPEARSAGLQIGDLLFEVDGRPIQERVDDLKPFLAASTPQAKDYAALLAAIRGPEGSMGRFHFQTASGAKREMEFERSLSFFRRLQEKDEPVFRKIDSAIGYVDLARLDASQVDTMFEAFRETRAIIMDMRGYPRGTAWSIAPRLSTRTQPVNALFRRNLVREGEVVSQMFEQTLPKREATATPYVGLTVMLIDERAISQSEHSGMMYRIANGTRFVGQPTTGANGDITAMLLPGRLYVTFSGHDVRWPDGRQLQRVGLQPDYPVAPTIQGLRSGRDEVLEKAIAVVRADSSR